MVSMISGDGRDAEDRATYADREPGLKHGAQAPGHALSQLLLRPWRWLRGRQGFELLVDQADGAADRRPAGAVSAPGPGHCTVHGTGGTPAVCCN